ncbi:ATP-binding cassette domain-containing protein [Actinophytocola oryzae]|uniref:ABC-2 type transport system ATP-binding protein n=1 Tax=Actinophytocola oryzae TaxID=502181 RepID=A0A4R7VRA4_9PSEU|nr:ATP-binding cassette domain-containing protein [Actinophytocola oryzae]TDV51985.1 ABC-2 type transport system ATP-binding protein [Actinophytocola oryzae]
MPEEPTIEATGLTKSYGEVRVLAGVDLHVPRGSVFSLLGPNGAGKTTTVRILTTLIAPDGGTARVAGHDIVRERGLVRRAISLTGQDTALDELQSGRENLQMMGRLCRLSSRVAARRADELLERFDLVEAGTRRVGTYSGGMRRRLDLAASLIVPPAVIFLDEPTTGLDPRSRAEMWRVITELTRSGVTIFLTTQYLEEADRLADRIALVDGGRIVAEGTSAQLKQRVAEHRLDLSLTDVTGFDMMTRYLGERALVPDRDRLTLSVATDGSAAHVRALLDDLDPARRVIDRFAVHSATLDDVFLALTGHATTAHKEPAGV